MKKKKKNLNVVGSDVICVCPQNLWVRPDQNAEIIQIWFLYKITDISEN